MHRRVSAFWQNPTWPIWSAMSVVWGISEVAFRGHQDRF
jgi:hypothetical protein